MIVCSDVLLFDRPNGRLGMGRKKRGAEVGKIQGYGGKLAPGETLAQCAIRELLEEAGVRAKEQNLWYVAHLTFEFPHKPEWSQVVHVFRLEHWEGEPQETEEMAPVWCDLQALPYDEMWDDARYWMPRVLEGRKVRMRFVYGEDNQTVAQAEHEEWPS